MFKPNGSVCQSCMMPMKADPQGGGTEADGKKSAEYCSYCYQNGAFLSPDMTVEQMLELDKKMLWKKMFIPGFIAGMMLKDLPKLKRWAH